jgi:tRNA G26 N,N-dimethylase Trm1
MLYPAINHSTLNAMIGIFKTNIATQEDRQNIIHAIRGKFEVGHCHVDLEDCDKVLRITEMNVEENAVISFVKQQGFDCEILD